MTRPLAQMQREFAAMLQAAATPAGRIGIYHHNRRANFRKALALGFPVIERVVGAEFFRQLADEYLARHPSRSGDLHRAGGAFAQFLHDGFAAPGSAYAYLADLARVEWAWQSALLAADAGALGVESLESFAAADWPMLRFTLQPALTLLHSIWPVHTLFMEHRGADPATVRLDAGGECLVVLRRGAQVEAHRLSEAEYALWQSLVDGRHLATALDAVMDKASASDAEPFDLGIALGRLFALGAVAKLELHPDALSPA